VAQKVPKEINVFLGLNENPDGETQLKLGESPYMVNFRITDNGKLKKREGYKQLFDSIINKSIQGMWYGKINGSYHFLFALNGNVYEHNLTTLINTSIGTLTDAKTHFFAYNNKVYIQNGHEYKYWDGTTFGDVAGYRPLVRTETPPTGGGTEYEEINVLTGAKRQWFSPDGTATEFLLAEDNITSLDYVKNLVTGTNYIEGTDYSKDLTTGKVTFTVIPTGGTPNTIECGWTKGAGTRSIVTSQKYAMFFGGENDTRVHMWGVNNETIYSGLADGVPSAEYFPASNSRLIGSDEYIITDIVRQYDRQIIFTDNDTYFSNYELISGIPSFPVSPLNSEKGNIAPGQAQVVANNPFTIFEGVYEWVSTSVRDERNSFYKSKRVQPSLDDVDLSKAITHDFEVKGEYWLCVGSTVWIYNYRNDTWYKYTNIPATCFITIDQELYFGTTNGQIMKFQSNLRNDNGVAIEAEWQMGFYDWGAEWLRKFTNNTWISLKTDSKVSLDVSWITDRDTVSTSIPAPIGYNLLDFEALDFEEFSFETTRNPKPFRIKTKAKKFTYFKLILKNFDLNKTVTVLSINTLGRIGGESK
jgi:hypothetical protein